jgi:hypothetical protein
VSGKSIIVPSIGLNYLPNLRKTTFRSPYTRRAAQGIENLGGGGQAGWVGHVPAVGDLAVGRDHQDGSANDVLEARGRAGEQLVASAEVAIEIAEQDQVVGQVQGLAPGVVGPCRVDADADDLRAEVAELGDAFSELGKLVRSTRTEVEDVGQQHHGAVAECIGQVELFGAADRQLEVRCGVANCEWGHMPALYPRGDPSRLRARVVAADAGSPCTSLKKSRRVLAPRRTGGNLV